MAFWGVEVRPDNPFTHFFDPQRGRLHISRATLGNGSASQKSVVQCNIGDESPVLLCALLPDKTESCGLALEFEEAEDVTFLVVGPRSVHLTRLFDDSGVGNKVGEESNDSKPRKIKGWKRRKKYQFSDSDDGGNIPISKVVNGRARAIALCSDEELPISSPCKTNNCGNNNEVKLEKRDDKEFGMEVTNSGENIKVGPEEGDDKDICMTTRNSENNMKDESGEMDDKEISMVVKHSENKIKVGPEDRDNKEVDMALKNFESNVEVDPEKRMRKNYA